MNGQNPLLPHTVDEYRGKNPRAFHFTKDWKNNVDVARAYLEKASRRMKKWADQGRRPLEFQAGDLVMVKLTAEQFRSLRSCDGRLVRRYEGPLPVIAKVGKTSYKLEPPKWMKVHPVFHVSNLKPYHPDEEDPARNQPSRAAVDMRTIARREERQPEAILADRVIRVRKGPRQEFLVKWKGLGDEETSWEKAEDLERFKQMIEDFEETKSTRASTD